MFIHFHFVFETVYQSVSWWTTRVERFTGRNFFTDYHQTGNQGRVTGNGRNHKYLQSVKPKVKVVSSTASLKKKYLVHSERYDVRLNRRWTANHP